MSGRSYGEFDAGRALAEVLALVDKEVPAAGPTVWEEEPVTEAWTVARGAGFLLIPLWEGESLLGVYDEWNDAVEAAEAHVIELAPELDRRWGSHREVAMHVPLFRKEAGEPNPPLFEALHDADIYSDLTVWGPQPGGEDGSDRWVALSVGHSDGDQPLVMVAAVTDRPIVELEE